MLLGILRAGMICKWAGEEREFRPEERMLSPTSGLKGMLIGYRNYFIPERVSFRNEVRISYIHVIK